MDYIPPERPALIAQARAEDRRHVYKFSDTGQIDQMDLLDDFDPLGTEEDSERVRKHGLSPGQYFPLCKAEDNQLTFYIQEHKPCSAPAFAAFVALSKTKIDSITNPFHKVPESQLKFLGEILGDKLDKSKFARADVSYEAIPSVSGERRGLVVVTETKQNPPTLGQAYYVVSDSKNRVIEEIGYKGAKKNDKYWIDEAVSMFASVKFKKENASDEQSKKVEKR